jgi:hypothetical protein
MKKSRVLLWLILLAIGLTGVVLYLIAPAAPDDLPHRLNGLLRELHGVAAALATFIFGYFFAVHIQAKLVKHGLYRTRQVWDGYIHLTVWVLLLVSGILLYYPHEVGVNVSLVHWYAGLLLIVIFPIHFWRKKPKLIRTHKTIKTIKTTKTTKTHN